jgi:tRNA pseudouridine38-40 synthase
MNVVNKMTAAPTISTELEESLAQPSLAQSSPDEINPLFRNWKLTLSYDGAGFSGWQIQPNERTIQGELQSAIRRVTGESPLPQGSGRTDAGVHALGQVASFQLTVPIPADNLRLALNRTLPPSIRVLEARPTRSVFHARHSAVAKTYIYRVYQSAICPPFLAPYVYACRWPFNFAQLNQAAQYFIGTHDFLSFAASDPDLTQRLEESSSLRPNECTTRSTIRTIFSSEWTTEPAPPFFFESGFETRPAAPDCSHLDATLLIYRVRGSGFLHHMVRNLVGTMLDAARGQITPDSIPAILAAKSRTAAGPTAPASGLFLHSVEYDGADME